MPPEDLESFLCCAFKDRHSVEIFLVFLKPAGSSRWLDLVTRGMSSQ